SLPHVPHSASLFFFVQCSGDHRHLHSFPTRRSSDLRHPDHGTVPDVRCTFPRTHVLSGSSRPVPVSMPEDRPPECRRQHHQRARDRKSTRLNSSHVKISYAVFCLKKKITHHQIYKRY